MNERVKTEFSEEAAGDRQLPVEEQPAGTHSALSDGGSAATAAKHSLKHDKALNKGLPDSEKPIQTDRD